MEFEWNASKEADNLRKHKVSFAEAVESFFDPHGLLLVDERNGENSGGCTVRKPRINDVRVDTAGTHRLRAAMAGRASVKITINVDADSLAKLKELSADSGVPYQRLLNSILKERLSTADTVHSRLDRIEKELARVKKTLAA